MLKELHQMTRRIESISAAGRDLIEEVHPNVSDIKQKVEDVAEAISTDEPNAKRSH